MSENNATRFTVDSIHSILVKPHWMNEYRLVQRFTAWLLVDGRTVSMIHYSTEPNDVDIICDIEVREDVRGNGYGLMFIRMLEQVTGLKFHTTGNYTRAGFNALSEHLPLIPELVSVGPQVKYGSLSFVTNWDDQWAD